MPPGYYRRAYRGSLTGSAAGSAITGPRCDSRDFIREHANHREPGGLRWGVEPICTVLTEHGLPIAPSTYYCLLYTSDAADDLTRVDLGGRRIIKKKKQK